MPEQGSKGRALYLRPEQNTQKIKQKRLCKELCIFCLWRSSIYVLSEQPETPTANKCRLPICLIPTGTVCPERNFTGNLKIQTGPQKSSHQLSAPFRTSWLYDKRFVFTLPPKRLRKQNTTCLVPTFRICPEKQ